MRLRPLLTVAVLVATVVSTSVGVVAPASAAYETSCADAGLTVEPLHGPRFYVDLSTTPVLRGAYAGYRVTDTSGASHRDLWVELDQFTGGSVALGEGQPDSQQIPTLPAGGSDAQFFYLTASALSTSAQQHRVSVWQGRPGLPGSAPVCSDTGGFTSVDGTIKAAANKLTSVAVSTQEPKIGSVFSVTVQGSTGTIGSGTEDDPQSFWMSPAALGDWPAEAYRLESTSLTFDTGESYVDTLRVRDLPSPSRDYTAVYSFRAVGFTATASKVLPVQQIASGTQIKHTDLDSVASLPAINPATNDMLLSASSTPARLPSAGGDVHVSVDVTGSAGAVLDAVEDEVSDGIALVPGSVTWNGQPVTDAVLDQGTLYFQGPFTLSGADDRLEFDLTIPADAGPQTSSLVARIGAAQIDTTKDLEDDAPATTGSTVNTRPSPADDAVTAAPGTSRTVDVLGNDTDVDADTLTITSVGTPTQGTASTDGTTVIYTPAGDATGSDFFTYTVSDGRGGTSTATVSATVTAASSPDPVPDPVAVDDTATVVAGGTSVIEVLGNDAGEGITVTDVDGLGAVVADGGTTIAFTAPETPGEYTISYTVADASGRTVTGSVTVTVNEPLPPAPVAVDDAASTAWNAPVDIDVLANDPEGSRIGAVAAFPEHGSVTVTEGVVRYTPDGQSAGPDSFSYELEGSTTPATVTVTVEAPVLDARTDRVSTTRVAGPVTVPVLANDDGVGLVVTAVEAPGHGEASLTADGVRYVPDQAFTGEDVLHYAVRDVVGQTTTASVVVEVANVRPTLAPLPRVRTVAGRTVKLALDGDDADGDRLEVTVAPASGSRGAATAVTPARRSTASRLVVDVAPRFTGVAWLRVTLTDGHGGAASRWLRVVAAPRPADGIRARVVPNPAAERSLRHPRFFHGRPVSRILSRRVDSRITWRKSPTRSVDSYVVRVDGERACRVDSDPRRQRQSCRVRGFTVHAHDRVRVVAIGQHGVRSERSRVPVTGTRHGHLLAVVYFPSGEFRLRRSAVRTLARLGRQADRAGYSAVAMVGHTDWDGSRRWNLRLSRQRAREVRDHLTGRSDELSVETVRGYGETRPAMPNTTSRGKAANRRVEVYVS